MSRPDRDETIRRIRAALKRRSGRAWSVTGGRGTAWGWIRIDAPPARRVWASRLREGVGEIEAERSDWIEYDAGEPGHHMGPEDRAELARLLGLETVHHQGVSIPSGGNYYAAYIERAETGTTSLDPQPYWD